MSLSGIWLPGRVELVEGHSLDLIEDFPEYDLLVTDPPYAFGNQGVDEHAVSATVATVLRESARRLRRGRWVDGPFTVETSEGPLTCQDGYLAVDARGYPYPIATDEFVLIYEPVKDEPLPEPVTGA